MIALSRLRLQVRRLVGLPGRAVAALLLATFACLGCSTQQPPPAVSLEITTAGTYLVDGAPVAQANLGAVLSAKRRPGAELFIHVIARPGVKYETVRIAMEAVQNAGGNVGLVGNEQFF